MRVFFLIIPLSPYKKKTTIISFPFLYFLFLFSCFHFHFSHKFWRLMLLCLVRLGHCWRSRDELISDALLWTPTYGRAKAGRPARTYIQQLCEDTGCSPEDLPKAMNDREKWRERVRDIRATSTTWWWWWWWWWWMLLSLFNRLYR